MGDVGQQTRLGLGRLLGADLAQLGAVRQAVALFQQGRAAYDAQRWDEALALFRQSMSALPSPNTRLYAGRCLRALGRNGEAWQELSRAATEANARRAQEPRFTPTAEAALAESMALTDRIAYVVVEVPDNSKI
jgi:tetratricopeptide (TPR) repeat protein